MIFAKFHDKEYVPMSTYEIKNRIKKLKSYYPELRQKEIELIEKRDDPLGEDFFEYLEDFGKLAIEYSTKCPDVIVTSVETHVKLVSKQTTPNKMIKICPKGLDFEIVAHYFL